MTLPAWTLGEMADRADVVVFARCINVFSEWNHETGEQDIFTALEVQDYLKNDQERQQLIVRHSGDVKPGAPGAWRLQADEHAVLFLTHRDLEGYRHVLGMSMGVLYVQQHEDQLRLERRFNGVELWDKDRSTFTTPEAVEVYDWATLQAAVAGRLPVGEIHE